MQPLRNPLFFVGLLTLWVVLNAISVENLPEEVKVCPTPPPNVEPTCDVRCIGDEDCLENMRCCNYGCSRACLTLV